MSQAEVISVGDEIACGQVVDSNAAWLSRRLAELGIPVVAHAAVRDIELEIAAAVRAAAERSEIVIVGGGLGPTSDDVTREAVAAAAGVELEPDSASLEHIRALFAARQVVMPPSNERQAMRPRGSVVLRNRTGSAPGFRVAVGRAAVFVLPGVPSELRVMFEDEVVPLLPRGEGIIVSRSLVCYGMAESLIGEKLGAEIDLNGDPKVAFLPSEAVIRVKFTTRAATREAALARIEPVLAKARGIIGEAVFGEDEDTLEQVVARLLEARNLTIAVAESCTGGLVADRLTNVPGISRYLLEGVVAYSNESKTRLLGVPARLLAAVGAVSEEVARAMAEGVRTRSGADIGVGTTGIAGPTGGSAEKPVGTVHVAVATARGTVHRKLALWGTRTQIKDRGAKHALNLVRLVLGGEK